MATILATLSISKSVDNDGKEITPDTGVETGMTRYLLLLFMIALCLLTPTLF